jgi:NDP-sugar pyrophosphorylase family protein
MNAVIVCGGLSTRLGEITKETPKVLLSIGGKTVLDWQLQKLAHVGVTQVVLAAGHLADVLKTVVGNQRQGIDIVYAVEEEKLGTGGAIKHAYTYLENPHAPTLVLNGDVLTTADINPMIAQLRSDSEGIIFGAYVDDASTYGTLDFDETTHHLRAFKEKEGKAEPGYINGGIYLFTDLLHTAFPKEHAFSMEYDVFPKMSKLYVYPSQEAWIDVGVPERLAFARAHVELFEV